MNELVNKLRKHRAGNSSARDTIKSITATNKGVVFVFSTSKEDAIWCLREVIMLLKMSGVKANHASLAFGPVINSILFKVTNER
jgi:RNase P/RNase MRP subunit p30